MTHHLLFTVSALLAGAIAFAAPAADTVTAEKLSVIITGGAHGIFTAGVDHPVLSVKAKGVAVEKGASLRITIRDLYDRPVKWDQKLPEEIGYYTVIAEATIGGIKLTGTGDYGMLPVQKLGLRKDSFFASNTSEIKRGEDLLLLQKIGMRIQRTHFNANLAAQPPAESNGAALSINFTGQDAALAEAKAHDTWPLPIVAYAFENTRSKDAIAAAMHGPPRNYDEFVNTWESILRHYPEITTYEFWNEPWILGWTWAANGAEYRKLQKQWCEMARRVNPDYRILAGNSSMFTEDHIEGWQDSWKGLLDGTTHHPYDGCGMASLRESGQGRSIDHGMMVTRRMGLPYYYITEGGSEYVLNGSKNNAVNARKLVQYFVRSALVGAFQGNAQWQIGYGPDWNRCNVTFGVMAHFLEDRPVAADVWPENGLLWGAVFAAPGQIDDTVKALPRAKELAVRWTVPVPDAGDRTKVAVLWAQTGPDASHMDTHGTIRITNPGDIKAYDLVGHEIPRKGGALVLPLGDWPVYVTTEALGTADFRNRLANAPLEGLTPINLYSFSLMQNANTAQKVSVRLQNQLNRPVNGTLAMRREDGKTFSAPFSLPAAKVGEVSLDWPVSNLPVRSSYPVTITARTDAGIVERTQQISVAQFVKRTITVDGTLEDWKGVAPVTVDSANLKSGLDLTQYLLNPNMKRPTDNDPKHVAARIYTAYDEENVYIAASVDEDKLTQHAGEPAKRGALDLTYKTGMPDGIDHIRNTGDSLFFAFGFRDRVPGMGREMDDPWVWKGHFYDTDYQYTAHASTEGDMLMRQWGPNTPRRTAYQTETPDGTEQVPGAKVKITRDEAQKRTMYEMAIPRKELSLFDPSAPYMRFTFMLVNDEGAGEGGALQWAEAAGVFDYWRNAGTFSPSWMSVLPCQTRFGIGK